MGGYQVRTENIKVGVGSYLNDISTTLEAVKSNFGNVTLPAPQAGDSIRGELSAVVTAWDEALPRVEKEIQLLGDAVTKSATMYEQVEVVGGRTFESLAR
jgi:hypothetical protein